MLKTKAVLYVEYRFNQNKTDYFYLSNKAEGGKPYH
ncbi:hypothetical protein HMPREF9711_01012 [Myroides odoratimimus CCUG 3837]|nr:hypothetical protein HMPREF9711_01012 [Myroides odoratimimus CCUG 3837]